MWPFGKTGADRGAAPDLLANVGTEAQIRPVGRVRTKSTSEVGQVARRKESLRPSVSSASLKSAARPPGLRILPPSALSQSSSVLAQGQILPPPQDKTALLFQDQSSPPPQNDSKSAEEASMKPDNESFKGEEPESTPTLNVPRKVSTVSSRWTVFNIEPIQEGFREDLADTSSAQPPSAAPGALPAAGGAVPQNELGGYAARIEVVPIPTVLSGDALAQDPQAISNHVQGQLHALPSSAGIPEHLQPILAAIPDLPVDQVVPLLNGCLPIPLEAKPSIRRAVKFKARKGVVVHLLNILLGRQVAGVTKPVLQNLPAPSVRVAIKAKFKRPGQNLNVPQPLNV